MAENKDDFPYLVPLIWQQDGSYPSPNHTNRFSSYGLSAYPSSRWNGTNTVTGGSAATLGQYTTQYNNAVNMSSPMEIYVTHEIVGNQVTVEASVEMLESITTTNNRILFVLTRNLDGVMNPNYFASVARFTEVVFPLTSAGEFDTFTQTLALSSAWDLEKVKIIVMVQSFAGTRIIHQANMRYLLFEMGAPTNLASSFDLDAEPFEVRLTWDAGNYTNTEFNSYTLYKNGSYFTEIMDTMFTDKHVQPNNTYTYYVVANYSTGTSEPSEELIVNTSVSINDLTEPPLQTKLGTNYPNPFNPSTSIYFDVHKTNNVLIEIYNLRGQLIKTLVNGVYDIGRHSVEWDGVDGNGIEVSTGVYFYRMISGDTIEAKRMILLK